MSRYLATLGEVDSVVGVDPGERFIAKAQQLADDPKLEFRVGDGTALDLEDGSFDAVVIHTVLCHAPASDRIAAEAASDYLLTIVDRGADVLAATGRIGQDEADARKAEARGRSENGRFFGFASYISAVATKA